MSRGGGEVMRRKCSRYRVRRELVEIAIMRWFIYFFGQGEGFGSNRSHE